MDKESRYANTPLVFCRGCRVSDKIYAIGGVAQNVGPVLGAVEEYDPATDTWTQKADMPTPRSGMAATSIKEKIYLIGGTPTVQGPVLETVEEYDPSSDTWTQKTDMPTPRTALAVGVVGFKNLRRRRYICCARARVSNCRSI